MQIFIFNLETNLDSKVLSAAHDWVESFAKNFEEVYVYSTHVGRLDLPPNVRVTEIGGGNFQNRLIALLRLSEAFVKIFVRRENSVVFHHMSPRTALLLGPFLRIIGVTQGLWYSHNHASQSLRLAKPFVNWIFSSTRQALPIQSRKTQFVGHGIKTERFRKADISKQRKRQSIISVGRIVPVKHLEDLAEISVLARISEFEVGPITLVGPQPDLRYIKNLESIFAEHELKFFIKPAVNYEQILGYLESHDFFFTGTPKSVDKAAIEAAIAGCFVVSTNISTLESTGMSEVWKLVGCVPPERISDQILAISKIDENEILVLRQALQLAAISRNELNKTISAISKTLIGDSANLG